MQDRETRFSVTEKDSTLVTWSISNSKSESHGSQGTSSNPKSLFSIKVIE